MSEAVPIYAPLDEAKVRRLFRNSDSFGKDQLTPVYENDVGEGGGFWQFHVLRKNDQFQGHDIQIASGDQDRDRRMAEFLAGIINNRDDVMIALAAHHFSAPGPLRQPWPQALDRLIPEMATAPAPCRRLDGQIHDAFQVDSTFERDYTASFDAALWLVQKALPGWGYKISCGPAPDTRIVATLMRPARNPEGSVTSGDSWSTHYAGTGASNAMALVHALLLAVKENPLGE